jgi:hypothetical protein
MGPEAAAAKADSIPVGVHGFKGSGVQGCILVHRHFGGQALEIAASLGMVITWAIRSLTEPQSTQRKIKKLCDLCGLCEITRKGCN